MMKNESQRWLPVVTINMRKPFREDDLLDMMRHHLGLRYIYDENHAVSPPSATELTLDLVALAALPSELLDQLEAEATIGRIAKVKELISRVQQLDVEVAGVLSQLAGNFEYPKIVAHVQAARKANYDHHS